MPFFTSTALTAFSTSSLPRALRMAAEISFFTLAVSFSLFGMVFWSSLMREAMALATEAGTSFLSSRL